MDERVGKVVEWNDAGGYGFVAPLDDLGRRVFFHVRSYRKDGSRPETGELVKFREGVVNGRVQATAVRRAVAPGNRPNVKPKQGHKATRVPAPLQLVLALGWFGAVAWAALHGRLPEWVLYALFVLCLATFLAYAIDKAAAGSRFRRIAEVELHLLELAGGWPGAVVAQQVFRHKTRKAGYRVAFWTMVWLNVAAMAVWFALRNRGWT